MTELKILIINEYENIKFLEQTLLECNYQVTSFAMQSLDLADNVQDVNPDVLILNVSAPTDIILEMLAQVNSLYSLPIIMFAKDPGMETVERVIKAGVCAYVVASYEAKRIKLIIETALARFKERQLLENELEKTKAKLEERKFIEKAKGILMNSQSVSEDQAYHTLRKLAMQRNVTLAEMAQNVISMASLLEAKQ